MARKVRKSQKAQQKPKDGVASKRYQALTFEREPYLVRARRLARITIPSLFREVGANGTIDTPVAWQSYGAYCVNVLTSKLSLTMFPPGLPFIRLHPSKETLQAFAQMDEQARGQLLQEIQKGLGGAEKEFVAGVDEDGDVDRLTVALRHLVVGGNHGLHMKPDGSIRGIALTNFVVTRDKSGNLLEFIIEDDLTYETLPDDIREHVKANGYTETTDDSRNQPVCVYTRGTWRDGQFHVYQECYGEIVQNTNWIYDREYLPFMFVPFNLLDGESYGRGYVEDYEGDIQSLDGLDQTVTEGAASAALYIRLVKPGGVTSKVALAQAQNGDVITGDANDVHTLEANKNADFATALERLKAKEDRLSKAFLLNSAVQRGGERVTAEEIRFVAQELQDNLGGVYSSQVTWFQRPYATLKMAALQRTKRMTPLPKKSVKAVIVTGAAALGRNAEMTALDALINVPPTMQNVIERTVDGTNYMQRRATALGVDQAGLIKSPAQQQQDQQAAAQQQMMQDAVPQGVAAAGKVAAAGVNANSQQAIATQKAQQAAASTAQQGAP